MPLLDFPDTPQKLMQAIESTGRTIERYEALLQEALECSNEKEAAHYSSILLEYRELLAGYKGYR